MTNELKPWNELPVAVRRSKRRLYEYIRTGGESEETPSDSEEDADPVNIAVTVTDGTDPVAQVAVAIGEITGTTGNAGGCTLSNVPVGSATVTATKEGYYDYSASITVAADTETLEIELEARPVYTFTSYADSELQEELATGTASPTGVSEDGYIEIEVLTNSVEGFAGNKYFVAEDATADGTTAYQLYTDAGTTGTGMYVTISTE